MSIRPLWRWPSRSFRQPAMASRTIVSSGDSLFVLLRPATAIRIVAVYAGLVVLFWLALFLL
jgi:hypothetical protein